LNSAQNRNFRPRANRKIGFSQQINKIFFFHFLPTKKWTINEEKPCFKWGHQTFFSQKLGFGNPDLLRTIIEFKKQTFFTPTEPL